MLDTGTIYFINISNVEGNALSGTYLLNYPINLLNKKDESLILKISSIDEKVKNLNKKYEKAANHADSFNSNDIARSFSNL
jgi:hypothetical protein